MFKCAVCGREHATREHSIFEKLRLVESGVPIETLFITPDEDTDDENVDGKLKEINKVLGQKTINGKYYENLLEKDWKELKEEKNA